MITTEHVTNLLRQHWGELGTGEPPPSSFSFVLVTKGRQPDGKLVMLAFPDHQPTPRFAIKFARLEEEDATLGAEYRNLKLVAPYATHGLVVTPAALLCRETEGRPVLVQTSIDGIELSQVTPRTRLAALVDPVVDWLIHLGRHTRRFEPPGHRGEGPAALIDRARRHATTSEERHVLGRISSHLPRAARRRLPCVFEHRDMATWNVMVSRSGSIVVLDWEGSTPDGVPTWDLFYFLAHYAFLMRETHEQGARLAAFQEAFLTPGPLGRTVSRAVRRYTGALGLSEDWLLPLFLCCWLHHALADVGRGVVGLSDSVFWRLTTLTLERDCRLNFLRADRRCAHAP